MNPWDLLSKKFDTSKKAEKIPSNVADNVLLTWPSICNFIQKFSSEGRLLRILEYGCGGGGFAHKLFTLGHQVIGLDSSEEMINTAKKLYG